MKTILIRGGTIVDGTGAPAFVGDVLIEGDRIAAVDAGPCPRPQAVDAGPCPRPQAVDAGPCPRPQKDVDDSKQTRAGARVYDADETIDATGCLVTPGFIDAHTHSDAYLVLEPSAPSKITQGITTEINGQCGGSVAPRYGEARLSSDWASLLGKSLTWHSLAEYRAVLDKAKPAVNTVQFIGHNTLRSSVVGYAARSSTSDETKKMVALLEQSLDEGGWGLTTGLIYQPGKYSTPAEVEALAAAAAKRGGFYATHMRSEGDKILESIDEVIELVKKTGIRAEISHLKTGGSKNWNKIDAVLDKMERAIADGLLLGSDRYPYCAAGTDLDVVLPDWAQEGAAKGEMERLKDEGQRSRIIEELNASDRDWSQVMIGGTWSAETKPFSGKTVAEILSELGEDQGERQEMRDASGDQGERQEMRDASGDQGERQEMRVASGGQGERQETRDASRGQGERQEIRDASGDQRHETKHHVSRLTSPSCLSTLVSRPTPGELICYILEKDLCRTGAFFFSMSEANLDKIYSRPWIVPGSDASLRAPWGPLGADHPHPRAYATMPEFYRRVRALGVSREETIARMTSVPARRFEIKGRGVLKKGAFADILVWREEEFKARATYLKPHVFSTGLKAVFVNGALTFSHGTFTGHRAGRFLERV